MSRKYRVLPALVLLVAVGATGAAVFGATAGSGSEPHDMKVGHAASPRANVATESGSTPMVEVPPPTQPPPATSPPAPPPEPAPPEPAPPEPAPPEPAPPEPAPPAPAPAAASVSEPSPPPPAPAPPQVASSPSVCGGSGSAILDAMNSDRAANGLGALCANSQLAGFAEGCANRMAQDGSLTHQDLGGLIGTTPFHAMGENIFVGPPGTSVAQMEATWMGSPGHRANILSGAFAAAASGIATSSDGRVWSCVDFGG